jgi:multicomponent Na+:H+ antiporter subunit C
VTAALAVAVLTGGGVFLLLRRGMVRIVVGFVLLGHAVNVLLLAAAGATGRRPPFGTPDPAAAADPLPQAFVLTAIVITFGITVYLLGLAAAGRPAADRGDGGTPGAEAGGGRGRRACGPGREGEGPGREGEGP